MHVFEVGIGSDLFELLLELGIFCSEVLEVVGLDVGEIIDVQHFEEIIGIVCVLVGSAHK